MMHLWYQAYLKFYKIIIVVEDGGKGSRREGMREKQERQGANEDKLIMKGVEKCHLWLFRICRADVPMQTLTNMQTPAFAPVYMGRLVKRCRVIDPSERLKCRGCNSWSHPCLATPVSPYFCAFGSERRVWVHREGLGFGSSLGSSLRLDNSV